MKNNKSIAALSVSDTSNLKHFPKELKSDTEFLTELMNNDPFVSEYLPSNLLKDKGVATALLHRDARCFEYLDKTLLSDIDLIELVIASLRSTGNFYGLCCLEKVPNAIKGQRDFAMRLAQNGYVLEAYRDDKEIVLEALKIYPNANVSKGSVDKWSNDVEVALLALYSGGQPITESSALYHQPNLLAVKFLEQIANTDADNLDIDAIEFIRAVDARHQRASGYYCFVERQIPKQDYEDDEYGDDDSDGDD